MCIRDRYEAMKKRIKYMYEKGDSSYLDILLQSKSMSELLNRAEYISKISEYDRNMLDQYAAVKDGIADDKAQLEKEKAELVVLQEQTTSKKNSVETLVNEKSVSYTHLDVYKRQAGNRIAPFHYVQSLRSQYRGSAFRHGQPYPESNPSGHDVCSQGIEIRF